MLKKLQSLKAKKGFTLVELIVVIAIIAVLAAILVPTMMGYVTSSRVTSLDSTAASLKDTVGNAMVETDSKGQSVPDSGTVTITTDNTGKVSAALGTLTAEGNTSSNTPSCPELVANIQAKLDADYNFNGKHVTAVIHIQDRKVVAAAYSDDSNAENAVKGFGCAELKSGVTDKWNGKTDGVLKSADGGYLIGTSPKLVYKEGTTSGTTSGTSSDTGSDA